MVSVTENEVHLERLPANAEKPKGHLHWLSAEEAHPCTIRLYDLLFTAYNPNELDDFLTGINKNSI